MFPIAINKSVLPGLVIIKSLNDPSGKLLKLRAKYEAHENTNDPNSDCIVVWTR